MGTFYGPLDLALVSEDWLPEGGVSVQVNLPARGREIVLDECVAVRAHPLGAGLNFTLPPGLPRYRSNPWIVARLFQSRRAGRLQLIRGLPRVGRWFNGDGGSPLAEGVLELIRQSEESGSNGSVENVSHQLAKLLDSDVRTAVVFVERHVSLTSVLGSMGRVGECLEGFWSGLPSPETLCLEHTPYLHLVLRSRNKERRWGWGQPIPVLWQDPSD